HVAAPRGRGSGDVLRIPGSQPHHQGTYQCLATNPAGQHSKVFQLHVHTPPSILGAEELAEVVVLLNGSGQLPCEARGSPAPTIAWFRGRRPLPSGTRTTYVRGGRALRVSAAQEADAGLYVCRATNPAGTAHRTVRLEVYGKAPVPPTISSEGRVVEAAVGQPVELLCSASGNPLPTLSWRKDGLPLPEGAGVLLLAGGTLLRVQRASESSAGSYTCLASSPAGESAVRHTLLVQVPPNIEPSEASETVLECEATGTPAPMVTWLKDGQPVATGDGLLLSEQGWRLRIARAALVHAGRYVCLAANTAGQERRECSSLLSPQFLQNSSKDQDTPATSVLRARMEKLCTEPKPDFLPCTGNPQPEVTWLKDGHPLPGGATSISPDGSVLRIPQAAPSDAGRYSCVASNPVGEQTKHYLLNVSGTRSSPAQGGVGSCPLAPACTRSTRGTHDASPGLRGGHAQRGGRGTVDGTATTGLSPPCPHPVPQGAGCCSCRRCGRRTRAGTRARHPTRRAGTACTTSWRCWVSERGWEILGGLSRGDGHHQQHRPLRVPSQRAPGARGVLAPGRCPHRGQPTAPALGGGHSPAGRCPRAQGVAVPRGRGSI
uniref:Ig-like domain-containing protein n=1 Tax=Anser brachyrhynchus TaxID=132585 RepID=A0A8B9CUB0_9AVES